MNHASISARTPGYFGRVWADVLAVADGWPMGSAGDVGGQMAHAAAGRAARGGAS